MNLTLSQQFEDGFAYDIRNRPLTVLGNHVGGGWSIPVGPGDGRKWKPGTHRGVLHDRNGAIAAEVDWQVTP